MNFFSFIAGRIREVLLNGRWIANTNYKELLSDLHWEQANRKVGNLNSIAALVFHVNYYLAGLLHAFQNGRLEISDKFSFDLPPIRSEEDWHALLHTFSAMLKNSPMRWRKWTTLFLTGPSWTKNTGAIYGISKQ